MLTMMERELICTDNEQSEQMWVSHQDIKVANGLSD